MIICISDIYEYNLYVVYLRIIGVIKLVSC